MSGTRLYSHRFRRRHAAAVKPCPGCFCGLAAYVTLISTAAVAQESSSVSLTGPEAIEARRVHPESLPYTLKSGDFRLLITSSLGLDYNDNIGISHGSPLNDFIVKPFLTLNGSYPVTANNLLTCSVGVGYDVYVEHRDYSGLRLQSGSQLSYDIYVKDFWINLHEQAKYTQNAAGEAAVANTGPYGIFDNLLGFSTTWDLRDLVFTLGYDHENYVCSSANFDYTDHTSELISSRAGFRFNPRLTAGLEGTVSFTAYDQPVLNDNIGYTGGLYADWQPGSAFHLQVRGGYIYYSFQQTSHYILAMDQDAWYAGITVSHQVTEAVNYTLSAGHELRLGIQADSIEDTYVRAGITWKVIKDLSLQGSFSYEQGTQGASGTGGLLENYSWFGGGFGVSRAITKKLTGSLNYRLTVRSSDVSARGYTQDVVGLLLTYTFQ